METIINYIRSNDEKMNEFFTCLRDSYKKYEIKENSFIIKIVDQYIDIHFSPKELKTLLAKSISFCQVDKIPEGVLKDDITTFFVWQDDLGIFHNKNNTKEEAHFYANDNKNIFIKENAIYLQAFDCISQIGFMCLNKNWSIDIDIEPVKHPFKFILHWWANSKNLILLHSAAVEIDNVGVLISSIGGKGKSTTALSCLFEGHSFAGDDYVILEQGPKANMICNSCNLNTDMQSRFPILEKDIIAIDKNRNNKALIDLYRFKENFKNTINISMILFPNVWNESHSTIVKMQSAKALGQMAISSALQNGFKIDKNIVHKILSYVSNLPVYQFNLSHDIKQNVNELERFVKEREEGNA